MCNQLVTIEVQEKFHARLGKRTSKTWLPNFGQLIGLTIYLFHICIK